MSHVQSQSDESTEAEPVASSSTVHRTLTAQAEGEDDGGSQPVSNSGPCSYFQPDTSGSSESSETETDDSYEWKQAREMCSGLCCMTNSKDSVTESRCNIKKLCYGSECDAGVHTGVKLFSCSECGEQFGVKGNLKRHMRIHTEEKPFICFECGDRFEQRCDMNRHMRNHAVEKPFYCSVCTATFSQKSSLMTHIRIHSGKKTIDCSECGKIFVHRGELNTHMRSHTGEKPFQCSACGERFGHKCNLITHMRIHSGERPFGCSECGKSFSQKGSLNVHMRIHRGEKPFGCSVCGKRFVGRSNLNRHMRNHTGEKPHGCSVCGKTFGGKSNLKRHMRNHTEEKPFSCCVCGERFVKNSKLKVHMRIHTGEKTCVCSECGERFGRTTNLKVHMRIHTGEKPFSCSECGKTFGQKVSLNRHMRIHAGEKRYSYQQLREQSPPYVTGEIGNVNEVKDRGPGSKWHKEPPRRSTSRIQVRILGLPDDPLDIPDKKRSFFELPKRHKSPERRDKWLAAIKRVNADGTRWSPSKFLTICSDHFVTGRPVKDQLHPDYVPSLFPHKPAVQDTAGKHLKRYKRCTSSSSKRHCAKQLAFKAETGSGGSETDSVHSNSDNHQLAPTSRSFSPTDEQVLQPLPNMQQVLERKRDIFHEQKKWNLSLEPKGSERPNIKQEWEELWSEDEEKPQSSQLLQSQRGESNSTEHRMLKIEVPGGSEPTMNCSHLQLDTDVMQQLQENKDVLHEQKKWNLSLDHKFSERPNIKQEREELWSDDEEKPQSSQLHQSQRDASNSTEHRALKTEGHGDDCGGSEPVCSSGTCRHLQPDADDIEQMMWTKEESFPEQTEWNLSVDQEEMKDKQKEVWISQQGEDLHQLDEDDIIEFSFNGGPVLTENDVEKPQSSQAHHVQSDESRHLEPVASSSTVNCYRCYSSDVPLTEQAEEDYGGPLSPINLGPCSPLQPDTSGWSSDCSETDDSYDWKQTENLSSGFNCNCSEYGKPCHHINPLKQQTGKPATEKQFKCSECGSGFGRKSSLVTHMQIHTGQKQFSCWECGNRFGRKSNLIRHVKGHRGHKPFACTECDKRFGHKADVVKHMQIHTGQKPFSCPECDKRFGRKCHLNTHMKIHTGEKPFRCSECGKRFGGKCTLNTHMKIHTGQKAFACSDCNKRFCQKGNLIRHMKIHTGEKPFGCCECDKRFRRKSHLITHMKIHKGGEPSLSQV
ncbi:uncharacterized protein LOC117505375 [Thalassophryne amazonica]|uniref:uncharacterized protein LOC117505375 n=1 Tax=Thalassophryne amazonica TaxID=390379 RepID=UPI0014721CA7|nr:uncharacterized protein LOC117505375 [Thalassophryne amazonica]